MTLVSVGRTIQDLRVFTAVANLRTCTRRAVDPRACIAVFGGLILLTNVAS
jgi:hypothetical protein